MKHNFIFERYFETYMKIVHMHNSINIVCMYKNCIFFNVYMLLIDFISTSEFTWLKTCVSYMSREIPTFFSVRKPIWYTFI